MEALAFDVDYLQEIIKNNGLLSHEQLAFVLSFYLQNYSISYYRLLIVSESSRIFKLLVHAHA